MIDKRFRSTQTAVKYLLEKLGVNPDDPNYADTPRRVAEWLLEKFPEAPEEDELKKLVTAYFPTEYTGMLAQTGIQVFGLCPHHLKDVEYSISIGYVPKERAIGLSKLSRLAEFCLGRAILQEDGTKKLADVLMSLLGTDNVAVVAKAKHYCMISRGVKQDAAITTTSEMRGVFLRNHSGIRNEFLALVNGD